MDVLIATLVAVGAMAGVATRPATATGRVLDVHGQPVAGATVEVSITNQDYQSVPIGKGTTDANGRFVLELSTTEYGDPGLRVEAPGFAYWSWADFPGGIVGEEIVLGRVVDRGFLERLRSVRDPAERARDALEVAASGDLPDIEEMFPYLGELRPELAAIVQAGRAKPTIRRDDSSPADHAARLLAFWADPADDALVEPWIEKNWGARPAHVAHRGLAAASLYEICDRWREIHFDDQGIADRQPPARCRAPVMDPTGTHALALFRVDYAHWGYDMHLVMRREGERWVLRGVAEGSIHHYRRPSE